ncbi:hypothetical protein ATCC90586_007872 [Pythium insidiosum]|nr:hypothetical protein ATCC90586_007872 [Pythium insidiosum]
MQIRHAWNSLSKLGDGIYRFTRHRGHARNARRGLNVTIVGGVHGNERIGVLVLDSLRQALLHTSQKQELLVTPGASVTLVYANERALRICKRGSERHADLNRCFTTEIITGGEGDGFEEKRARELAPVFADSDVLIDIHSTNKPSEPFLRIAGHPGGILAEAKRIASRLPCKILLHDPRFLLAGGRVALTDEYVGACGGLGICFESGIATDLSQAKVESITQAIVDILQFDTGAAVSSGHHQLVDKDVSTKAHEVYEITDVFKLTDEGFRWGDGVGTSNFQRVVAGSPIGFIGADDMARPLAVDYDAFIVFPKIPELWQLNAYVRKKEIDACRESFVHFDRDGSGTIDKYELAKVLEAMGQKPTDEELFQMIAEVDNDNSGEIEFAEFLKVMEAQKIRAAQYDDESDFIDAFVACGGNPDKTGHVERRMLVQLIKKDFGLPIDIDRMIDELDTDGSGEIEYEEFKALLS